MLDQSIQELEARFLERADSAATEAELEAVRVEALGRKSPLAQFGKEMGKLAAEDRARIGKLLNSARQNLEQALDARKQAFAAAALTARLDTEWLDLTLP